MEKNLRLFALGKPLSKAAQIELEANSLLVDDDNIKQQYKEAIGKKSKKAKKVATIEEITAAVKREVRGENCLEGFEQGIGKVSASKLTTYRGCHFAYLLQYRLHLQPHVYFPQVVFGECFHYILEDFNTNRLITLDDLIFGKEVQVEEDGKLKKKKIKGWKGRWYGAANSRNIRFRSEKQLHILYNKGVGMLKDFFEKEQHNPKPAPEFVERKFDVMLDCRPYLNRYYRINGFFDKIDKKNEKVIITDYKTGHVGAVSSDLGLQLTLYWYAYNKWAAQNALYFPKQASPENIELVMYHLPTLEEKHATRDNIALKYLINEIHNADSDIKAKNFTPFIGSHCDTACFWQESCYELLMSNNKDLFNFLISQYTNMISEKSRTQ